MASMPASRASPRVEAPPPASAAPPAAQGGWLTHKGSNPTRHHAVPPPRAAVSAPATATHAQHHRHPAPYPPIDCAVPGLERLHAEPPVYVAHGLLSAAQCEALVGAAKCGALPALPYDNAVLLDTHRLWPLALVVAAGAAFDTWHAGGDVRVAPLAAAAAVKWAAGVGGVVAAARLLVRHAIGGRVFTGTKWTTRQLFDGGADDGAAPAAGAGTPAASAPAAAADATEAFLRSTARMLCTPPSHLEAPTVTRYGEGQQQRVHFDGRPRGDPQGLAEFMAVSRAHPRTHRTPLRPPSPPPPHPYSRCPPPTPPID